MLKIGPLCLDSPVLLAPMEDVTNQAFRLIAKRIARPGMMFTEFVSAMAVHHGARATVKKMNVAEAERPLGIQIFGGDPQVMAETARVAESFGCDLIDINMGCWVPKVCRTGSGAALLKDPDLAQQIVAEVVKAVSLPVTVKVRAGWDYSLFAAPELAQRFAEAGAKMITLHARFAKQGFTGSADWDLIARMKQAVKVPVIGNGDVKTADDALRMMRETDCNGVMVGRAAISDPWALARIRAGVAREGLPAAPTLDERIATALTHLRLSIDFETEHDLADGKVAPELRACRSLRGQIPLYIRGVPGAAAVRERLTKCNSYAEFEDTLRTFAATCLATA